MGPGAEQESVKRPYVVMKARQVGSEIRGYDLRSSDASNTLDPSFLKVSASSSKAVKSSIHGIGIRMQFSSSKD